MMDIEEFEEQTKTIRDWCAFKAVPTDKLIKDLRFWADRMARNHEEDLRSVVSDVAAACYTPNSLLAELERRRSGQ